MNQRFLAKLRNALGLAALLCVMMSAKSLSAQNFLPSNQAVQVVKTALNTLNETGTIKSAGGAVATPSNSVATTKSVNANSTHTILLGEYLRAVLVELKQGQPTGTAVNNVYNAILNQGAAGNRLTILDAVKQDVVDLLTH